MLGMHGPSADDRLSEDRCVSLQIRRSAVEIPFGQQNSIFSVPPAPPSKLSKNEYIGLTLLVRV